MASQSSNVGNLIDFFNDEVTGTSINGMVQLVHANGHIYELTQADTADGCVEVGIKNESDYLADLVVLADNPENGMTANGIEDSASVAADADHFRLQLAKSSFEQGVSYWGAAEYDMAMVELRRSMELREAVLGKMHEDTYQSYFWIATIYWHKGLYEKALEVFCHAFHIKYVLTNSSTKMCGVVSSWITKALDALHLRDDEIDEYWTMLVESVEQERQADDMAEELRFSEAIDGYKQALTTHLNRRSFLVRHSPLAAKLDRQPQSQPDLAHLHVKIGDMYTNQRMFNRAMISYRKALCVVMVRFGPYSTYTARAMEHLKQSAIKAGLNEDAIQRYMPILEKSVVCETRGDMLLAQKDMENAAAEFRTALECEESSTVGRVQLTSASMYCKLGSLYADMGDYDGALPLFCKGLAVYHQLSAGDEQHPDAQNTMKMIKKLVHRQAKQLQQQQQQRQKKEQQKQVPPSTTATPSTVNKSEKTVAKPAGGRKTLKERLAMSSKDEPAPELVVKAAE